MQLHFTGKNFTVSPALKEKTTEKFQKLESHYEQIRDIYVVFSIENITQIVEATVHIDGTEIHAKAESKDMYDAIDILVKKLESQLNRHKEKNLGNRT